MINQTLFLHGGNEFHADSAEFDQYFVSEIAGARVGIFPGASESTRDQIATVAFASGYFALYGIELTEVMPSEFATIDALILPGGSPHKLLAQLTPFRAELTELYERGVIYGASAGAMVLGQGYSLGGKWHAALGLGQFQALVHFNGNLPAHPSHRLGPAESAPIIYGLPEGGGLAVAKSGAILTKSSGVQIGHNEG